jgi:hypothetical protein
MFVICERATGQVLRITRSEATASVYAVNAAYRVSTK